MIIGLSAFALVFAGSGSGAAEPQRAVDLPAEVLAMQRDLGVTAEQAGRLATQAEKADRLDDVLRESLGSAFGGAWFDISSGKLVVGVTDASKVSVVRTAGAQPQVVKHSEATLESIKAELDALSGKPAEIATRTDTPTHGVADAVKGLASWAVDPKTNSVVVTVVKGQPAKALSGLARHGDAVRVEYTDVAPSTAAFLDGGDLLGFPSGSCSVGFNMRNVSNGKRYVLTAGHCPVLAGYSPVNGQGGVLIGNTVAAFFPTYDDALVEVTNPGAWTQGPWVDTNPSNGGVVVVANTWSNAPNGTPVCKSGITTKLTCGTITAQNVSANYPQGTVYNLKQHNACTEPGDSGGSVYNNTGARPAEGVTSGGTLYGGLCGQKVGQPNVSFYYPAYISVPYYNSVFGATLW